MDDSKIKYVRSNFIERIIKNCRGVKKCKDDTDRKEKGKQREILLGFKEMTYILPKNNQCYSQ